MNFLFYCGQCCLLVTNDADNVDSFKCCTAIKYNIPVVSFEFLRECVKERRWLDPELFCITGETSSQLPHQGFTSSSSEFSSYQIIIVQLNVE